MISKYNSKEFKDLRGTLYEIFDNVATDPSMFEEKRNLAIFFCEVLEKDNISILFELDKLKLTSYGLFNTDDTLINIYQDRDLSNTNLNKAFDSLFLTLYADFYSASIAIEPEETRLYFKNMHLRLHHWSHLLSADSYEKLTRLWFRIPRDLFHSQIESHFNADVLDTVKELKTNKSFVDEKIDEIGSLQQDILAIRDSLTEQRKEYNFVGLSDGFKTLRDRKQKELNWQNGAYYALMAVIILLIISKSAWSANYLVSNNFDSPIFIIVTISTVLFLFILLYFFRISLVNVKSIKSQILQIDLRLTLCQFIHNYDSDTKELREGMKESFERFESVIFAPIVATEDQMPATFDGLEQLTGLLSSFNKGSK